MVLVFFACQKDWSESFPPDITTSPNYPLSLVEVIAFFAEYKNTPVNSLGDSTKFIDLEPLWDESSIGYSELGKEILIVPLPDSAFNALNNGRTGGKLLFSMSGPDSVTADIVVYVADSAYYQTSNGIMDFNTFTGAYIFYDIAQNFKYLLYADSGVIVGGTDTLLTSQTTSIMDRQDCGFTRIEFQSLECKEVEVALQLDCYEVTNIALVWLGNDCGGGGGGGGGNNINYWSAFNGTLPISYFQANPSALPPGFDINLFRDLVQVAQKLNLTQGKIGWLINNRTFIPHLANFIENHEQEEGALDYAKDHFNLLVSDQEYRDMVKKSFGWPAILM